LDPSPAAGKRRLLRLAPAALAVGAVVLIVAAVVMWKSGQKAAPASRPAARESAQEEFVPRASSDEIRILAGYPRKYHMDILGRVWEGDRYFTGGRAVEAPRQLIARTPDPTIFRYCRAGDFKYDIPLKPGVYELRLYFAESLTPHTLTAQPAGSFLNFVYINGAERKMNLNFASDGAGSSTADVRVFKDISPAKDGFLHLRFAAYSEFSFVNAIEITPGVPNRLRPIRIWARDHFYTDHLGRIWPPDRYFRGGSMALRRDGVSGTEDPELFSSERFGSFDYLIPVAQGTYAITFGFAETWFGSNYPGGGGVGARVFDVFNNGTPLIKDLDVFREAGGAGKMLMKTIHGVRPDADGKLRLVFAPSRNYAMVNTIEIEDESK
jgi:hypothetical protein